MTTVSYSQPRFGYGHTAPQLNLTSQKANKFPQNASTVGDSFNFSAKSPKFSSVATAVSANTMYLDWLAEQEKKKKQEQEAQQLQSPVTLAVPITAENGQIKPLYPVLPAKPTKPSEPRFGTGTGTGTEVIFTPIWFKTQSASVVFDKVASYLIASILKTQQDQANELAIQYLRNAENSSKESDKREYLKLAEKKLLRVAKVKVGFFDSQYKYATIAHAYKELAVLAKALGRDERVVNDYVEQCMENFEKYAGVVKSVVIERVKANASPLGPFQRPSQAIKAYEEDDTAEVCNKLHSRKTYVRPSIEPGPCAVQ